MDRHRFHPLLLMTTVWLLLFGAIGCKKVTLKTECTSNDDCGSGEKCKDGVCVSSSDGDADGDADGDTDGDADGDSDGDADGDCDSAVEGAADWGYPCELNSDCEEEGLVCLLVTVDGGAEERGYCTPVCCDLFGDDEGFCTDVAGGREMCIMWNGEMTDPAKRWCAITCDEDNDGDCPKGLVCLGYDNPVSKGICYPPQ